MGGMSGGGAEGVNLEGLSKGMGGASPEQQAKQDAIGAAEGSSDKQISQEEQDAIRAKKQAHDDAVAAKEQAAGLNKPA